MTARHGSGRCEAATREQGSWLLVQRSGKAGAAWCGARCFLGTEKKERSKHGQKSERVK